MCGHPHFCSPSAQAGASPAPAGGPRPQTTHCALRRDHACTAARGVPGLLGCCSRWKLRAAAGLRQRWPYPCSPLPGPHLRVPLPPRAPRRGRDPGGMRQRRRGGPFPGHSIACFRLPQLLLLCERRLASAPPSARRGGAGSLLLLVTPWRAVLIAHLVVTASPPRQHRSCRRRRCPSHRWTPDSGFSAAAGNAADGARRHGVSGPAKVPV